MFKKIFALSVLAVALFAFANSAKSQTMYFCENVDDQGYPIGESSVFNIGSGGGYLDVLVRLPYTLGCRSVSYELYLDGVYNTTIYQDTQRNWEWFYKQITFYSSGSWQIYCVDCNGVTLASGTLRIQYR
jgi:hypothetical protein